MTHTSGKYKIKKEDTSLRIQLIHANRKIVNLKSKLKKERKYSRKYRIKNKQAREHLRRIKSSYAWKITFPFRITLRYTKKLLNRSKKDKLITHPTNNQKKVLYSKIPDKYQKYPQNLADFNEDNIKIFSKREKILLPTESQKNEKYSPPIILYRIIGNDLATMDKNGQCLKNIKFILKNEYELTNCHTVWILNRIVCGATIDRLVKILSKHNQEIIQIPFLAEDYSKIKWTKERFNPPHGIALKTFNTLEIQEKAAYFSSIYRHKNKYLMNTNGARNFALNNGKTRAEWILAWDGNCFIPQEAWNKIRLELDLKKSKYYTVPTEYLKNNEQVLLDNYQANPTAEPQIIIHKSTDICFNEEYAYGYHSKTELFWHLGIKGEWNNFKIHPSEPKPRNSIQNIYSIQNIGWVSKLVSMNANEPNYASREKNYITNKAILNTNQLIDKIDNKMKRALPFCAKHQIDMSGFLGQPFHQSNTNVQGARDGYEIIGEFENLEELNFQSIFIKTEKRFSNSLTQITNAISFAINNNIKNIICNNFWYLPKAFKTQDNINIINLPADFSFPSHEQENLLPCLSGLFFYNNLTLSNLYPNQIQRIEILNTIREKILITSLGDLIQKDNLVIHIRSGDIFTHETGANPNYGQPPLCFYTKIIKLEKWKHIHLVFENKANPIIQPLIQWLEERNTAFTCISGSLQEDINYLLRAETVAVGRGTFMQGVLALSKNIKRIYSFESSSLNSQWKINAEQIEVVDVKKEFVKNILKRNWINSDMQRELMLSYSENNLKTF